MEISWKSSAQLFAVFLFFTVCDSAYGQKKRKAPNEPPPPTIVKLSAAVPSFAALAESPQSQTKGGLRITLAPEAYKAQESWTEQSREVPPPSKFGLVLQPAPNAVYVEKIRTPTLAISPDVLVFHVHLNNGLPRVFRGSGIAVQFNIAGKVVTSEPAGYGDLINIILPPRSEQEITILGPKISVVPAPSTVGVFFYDVVTGIDQAGNVTEKQNFEWYFSFQTQATDKEFSVPAPQRSWIVPQ